jgi:Domain of unknown function (DUF4430)
VRLSRKSPLAAAAALVAAAAGGCGFGAGATTDGEASLTVTRDYGRERLLAAVVEDPRETETVLRFLDREAEIGTRFGGGFVHSIEGVAGGVEDGRSLDWFFYVNGIESSVGSADRGVGAGDRIWWDYRDWTAAMRVPAVVGSWPEPFLQASAGADRLPVRIVCEGARPPCEHAVDRLADAGVEARVVRDAEIADGETLRLLVGPWTAVRDDPAAALLASGPARSGVFTRVRTAGDRPRLLLLDERGHPTLRLAVGAGLVAAVRDGEDPPTWVVTGTDRSGVAVAVAQLDGTDLADRYAVAATGRRTIPLPVEPEGAE